MRQAVWAHTSSTDDESKHWFCPKGKNSWSQKTFHVLMGAKLHSISAVSREMLVKEERWDKTVTVEENCSKIKYCKIANNPTKKMKLVKRQLDFQFSESKNTTHSFEAPDIDTDDDLDTEILNDKDYIICAE
ncbi:hypothetical protein TNCV_4234031 [Trichonephila clavipes]|nr:hypothetical protein TNCV_4234031 [Trichonephila clavipes]